MDAAFEYIGISVGNLQAQKQFYMAVFATDTIEAEMDLPDAGIRTVILRASSGLRIELIERVGSVARPHIGPHEQSNTQGFSHLAVRVGNLANAVRTVDRAGGTMVLPPTVAQRPGVQFAYVHDPEGNLLELTSEV